jgi:hypothetical protein
MHNSSAIFEEIKFYIYTINIIKWKKIPNAYLYIYIYSNFFTINNFLYITSKLYDIYFVKVHLHYCPNTNERK